MLQRIEKPLANLVVDLCIPPALATLILDTRVGEDWIPAIVEFERRLDTLKLRVRVKAARDLSEVAEGLRIVVSTCLQYLNAVRYTETVLRLGRHQTTNFLPGAARTYTDKHDYKLASHTIVRMDEIQATVHIPATACSQRRT